jgi:hypothetical protein
MAWPHNFIVVDEYDNVVHYFNTQDDATARAKRESEVWQRDTWVYAITEVASYKFEPDDCEDPEVNA